MSGSLSGAADSMPRPGAAHQCAPAVLMVRPANFAYNPETALTNAFQRSSAGGIEAPAAAARAEFASLASALADAGVAVSILDDTPQPPCPDAVFPNNWISFHGDGTVVLYPMQAESRRRERRRDAIEAAVALGFRVSRTLDLTAHEAHGRYLEGTGSLVLDHWRRIAYACLSPRTHPAVLEEWAAEMDYRSVAFSATDRSGVPLYHTNVLMCVGERFAVIGREAIAPADRDAVMESLRGGDREILEIDQGQIEHFAGNMLELTSREGQGGRVLVMSECARRALPEPMFERLSACTDQVIVAGVPTIERLGGGSVRCMLAEVFLS